MAGTLIAGGILLLAVAGAVFSIVRKKKSGKGSCGCGCSSCSAACSSRK
ncbi:MAG: FeoB-associated Cys-rich membrane protein [Treponema sp.]|nr:FeoB-associated Cys-rich membrane protein [Treponema sp.]